MTHEVLGIARGEVKVEFGGAKGNAITLKAGDVAILPAGNESSPPFSEQGFARRRRLSEAWQI
jgi:uncharacterized protein YjlB